MMPQNPSFLIKQGDRLERSHICLCGLVYLPSQNNKQQGPNVAFGLW